MDRIGKHEDRPGEEANTEHQLGVVSLLVLVEDSLPGISWHRQLINADHLKLR